LIWVKRLAPFILLGVAWLGYHYGRAYVHEREAAEQDRMARLTARVWVATAIYRNEPDRYIQYRDSLLAVERISRDDLDTFLKRFENKPEEYLPFTLAVQAYVDSLVRIEDSLIRETQIRVADSLRAADRR